MFVVKFSSSVFRVFMMTINNKNENNDWGKCLGLPVTGYGPARGIDYRVNQIDVHLSLV